jgi:hypothetical protein
MDGSNLAGHNPARRERGKVALYAVRDGDVCCVDELPGGEAGQGIVFTADSRHVLAQFNVEKEIAVYAIESARLRDTGHRIARPGGPSSIRSMPR